MNFQDLPESSAIFKHTPLHLKCTPLKYKDVKIVSNSSIIISMERYLLITHSVRNPATISADKAELSSIYCVR